MGLFFFTRWGSKLCRFHWERYWWSERNICRHQSVFSSDDVFRCCCSCKLEHVIWKTPIETTQTISHCFYLSVYSISTWQLFLKRILFAFSTRCHQFGTELLVKSNFYSNALFSFCLTSWHSKMISVSGRAVTPWLDCRLGLWCGDASAQSLYFSI